MSRAKDPGPARYHRVCSLGEGGTGTIDLVLRREGRFLRRYAMKRPHPALRASPEFRAMFLDEARLAGLVHHPNVLSALDVGEDADGPYLILDYVEGRSLAELLGRLPPGERRLPRGACVAVAAQVAHGLHAAHELRAHDGRPLGLVHRDVCTRNILIGWDGLARVTDFGIAKAFGNLSRTSTGILKGSVAYMAPEYLRFQGFDRRSDLFSLGIVLYEMLTGEPPFAGADAAEIARRIMNDDTPDVRAARADTPPELADLVRELLAKDQEQRPADARVVAERLDALRDPGFSLAAWLREGFAAERAAATARIAAAERAARRRVRPAWVPWAVGALCLAAAGVASVIGVNWWFGRHGLRGEYYAGTEFERHAFTRTDSQIIFDWSGRSPGPGLSPDNYSVRWTGWLVADETAARMRELCLRSDDGDRLWLDGELLIDAWSLHQLQVDCAEIELEAGRRYAVRLDYFQGPGAHATIMLLWRPDKASVPTPVPSDRLRPP